MGNLLVILLCLFGALAVVVVLTGKFSKPISNEQQSKLSRIIMVLIFVMLVARLIQYLVEG
jgi:hypothetical protein